MKQKIIATLTVLTTCFILTACTPKQETESPTATPEQTVVATPTVTETPTSSPSATPIATKKATPKASTSPLVDCVGPDGKTAKMTQKACDDFKKAWNVGTPTPTAAAQVTGCGAYNPAGPLGTARVTVKLESGQDWRGAAVVTFSQKYPECKGNGLDYAWQDSISGTTTKDYGAFRPGPYKVEVTYYNKKWSTDVNLNGGTTEVTVTVSNN